MQIALRSERVSQRHRSFLKRAAVRFLIYALLLVGLVLVMIPFYWLLRTSLMWEGDIFLYPPKWLPNPIVWENYVGIFQVPLIPMHSFWRNTLIMSVLSALGDMFSASLVGYSLGRLQWRWRNVIFISVIATMFLPSQVTIIPTYIMWSEIGFLNTLKPLIIPSWLGHPFYIFLMRQFVRSVPTQLDDAARIDGCGLLGIYRHIILPLTGPALATVGIFAFQNKWNQFFLPLIYVNSKEKLPLAVGLYFFKGMVGSNDLYTSWSHLMAAATLSVLPILIIFFFAQRVFIQGIVVTGVKG